MNNIKYLTIHLRKAQNNRNSILSSSMKPETELPRTLPTLLRFYFRTIPKIRTWEKLTTTDIKRNTRTRLGRCLIANDINLFQTALSYIASNGPLELLELILQLPGLDPNKPDNEGNTPLHFAAQAGKKRN